MPSRAKLRTGKRMHNKTRSMRAAEISTQSLYGAVKRVLTEFAVPDYYYSIGEFADECVCLERSQGKWIVYDAERGQRLHLESYDSVYPAACTMFESVVLGDKKLKAMKRRLSAELESATMGLPFKVAACRVHGKVDEAAKRKIVKIKRKDATKTKDLSSLEASE